MGTRTDSRGDTMDAERPYPVALRACTLITENDPDAAYRLFEVLTRDLPGLVISRPHPHLVRRRRGVAGRVVWLTETLGEDFINPAALGRLETVIRDCVEENRGEAVVLLDGVEYLVQKNGFDRTLSFLEHVNDFVVERPATVLLPVRPDAFQERELAVLEREFPVLSGMDLQTQLETRDVTRLLDESF